MGILSAIGLVFGKLMFFIYNTVGFHNYALSLIFFTIVYKLILLPLSIKQTKSSLKMQELQPELQRLQERYKNDKEKLNEMTAKFYQEKGYNPASGCLPMLIQLPIIIALFYVIRMPMSYMLEIPAKAVGELAIVAVQNGDLDKNVLKKAKFEQIQDKPMDVFHNFSESDYYFEVRLVEAFRKHPEMIDQNETLSAKQKETLKRFNIKMFNVFNFGIPPTLDVKAIAKDPANTLPPLFLLALAVVTTYVTTMLMMPKPDKTKKDAKSANAGCASKGMLWISPLMTLWIGSTTPSGLSFYWTINNLLSYAQQRALSKMTKKEKANVKEEGQVVKVDNKRGKNSR